MFRSPTFPLKTAHHLWTRDESGDNMVAPGKGILSHLSEESKGFVPLIKCEYEASVKTSPGSFIL